MRLNTLLLPLSEVGKVISRTNNRKRRVRMTKAPMIPINPADVFKLADRLISAYERSCELEVEKERVDAELELGKRKIKLEEKRLDVQYKAAVKILDVECKKLDAALKVVEQKSLQTKAWLERCDFLMQRISVDENESRRNQMLQIWMALHGGITQQLGNSSDDIKALLVSGSQNLAGTAAKMLMSKNSNVNAIECGEG
mgnify:CR=1 FL=1